MEDSKLALLHGHCDRLAIALHRRTGLPIGAYLDIDFSLSDEGQTVLVHAFVVDGDDGIDVRGRRPVSEMLGDEFEANEPWFEQISEETLIALAGKPEDAPAPIREAAYAEAERLAAQFRTPAPAV